MRNGGSARDRPRSVRCDGEREPKPARSREAASPWPRAATTDWSAPTPSTAVPRYGLAVAARPISSRTTAASAKVAPAPSSASGTSRPSHPASASSAQSVGPRQRRSSLSSGVARLAEQVACHGPQVVVEVGEFVHGARRPAHAGRPRPRSPMIVRWISLEPPGIVHSHELMKSSTHAPDSHPLEIGFASTVCPSQADDLGAEVGHPLEQLAVVQLDDRGVGGTVRHRFRPARPGCGTATAGRRPRSRTPPAGPGPPGRRSDASPSRRGSRARLDQPAEPGVAEPLGQLEHGHPPLGAERRLGHLPARVLGPDELRLGDHARRRGTSRRSATRRWPAGSVGRRCPGVVMSIRKYEMPCRFGASGSVRASSRHQSAWAAPLAHTFWPFTTKPSPSRRALVVEAGEVGAGIGLGEPLAPDLAVEDGGQVPLALLVGARVRAASTRRGGSTRTPAPAGARRAPRAPGRARSARRSTSRRPTPPASAARRSPRAAQLCEPRLLERRRTRRRTRRSARRASPAGTWVRHHSRTSARNSSSRSPTVTIPFRAAAPAAAAGAPRTPS